MNTKHTKRNWKKEYILWGIVLLWTILVWEGHRFLPGAKRFGEVIPIWIVILNLLILFITLTLLANIRNFSLIGSTVTIIGFSISLILYRIGGKHFPLISSIGIVTILLIIIGLKVRKKYVKKKNEKASGLDRLLKNSPNK